VASICAVALGRSLEPVTAVVTDMSATEKFDAYGKYLSRAR
jgi:hypothetical protein